MYMFQCVCSLELHDPLSVYDCVDVHVCTCALSALQDLFTYKCISVSDMSSSDLWVPLLCQLWHVCTSSGFSLKCSGLVLPCFALCTFLQDFMRWGHCSDQGMVLCVAVLCFLMVFIACIIQTTIAFSMSTWLPLPSPGFEERSDILCLSSW